MSRFNLFKVALIPLFASVLAAACAISNEPATPVETFQTYVKAIKQKDTSTMKLLLSSESIKMHEQEAKAQGVTLDDIVKRETLLGEGQRTVKFRHEKIEGEKATLEYENPYGMWETMDFVFENGEWKIDKKGFADQMIRDIEQNTQQFDDMLNRGKQPF